MIFTVISQTFGFTGALCLLLYGMEMLSNGIQKGAGSSLQSLLRKISGNRVSAVLTGIAVTSVIQSSGATTVMVVSFINAEIITLTQAISIIFGANIGTTVTAWIVSFFGFSFSLQKAAIPLFGFGFILKYFKKFRIHNFADCFMGFAILFMGLDLLKSSMNLRPESVAFLNNFENLGLFGLLSGIIIGAFFTALIHSSSATTAIVLTMAANGSLSWNLSAAVVLGSNIGSTIDAVMSSFGANVNARRTAAVHVAFNVIGTLIVLCFFNPFLYLIDLIVPGTPQANITTHIAMLHTLFNVSATLLFLPFVDQIASIAKKIIKNSIKDEIAHYRLPAILPASHISSDLYYFQIQKEITKMAELVMEMMETLHKALNADGKTDEVIVKKIETDEEYIDEMNTGITAFLQKCTRLPDANHKKRNNLENLISVTQNLEELSDECLSMVHTICKFHSKTETKFLKMHIQELNTYFEQVYFFFDHTCSCIALGIPAENKIHTSGVVKKINTTKKELKKSSRKRLEDGSDVKAELNYMDMLRKIEKAGECVFRIVQSFAPAS